MLVANCNNWKKQIRRKPHDWLIMVDSMHVFLMVGIQWVLQEMQRVQKYIISSSEHTYSAERAFHFSHGCTCILSVAFHSQSPTLMRECGFWARRCSEFVTKMKIFKFMLRTVLSTGRNSTAYITWHLLEQMLFFPKTNIAGQIYKLLKHGK